MIVALEYIWLQSTGGIMMAEVKTEEEAFAEMRRFLEVNQIPSDVTSVNMVEEREYAGRTIPCHKEVRMCQYGYIPPMIREFPDPCFGIYYGADKPQYDRLKSIEEYGLTVKKDYYGKIKLDEHGYPVLVNDYYDKGNKWYMPMAAYLKDLEKRKAGEE